MLQIRACTSKVPDNILRDLEEGSDTGLSPACNTSLLLLLLDLNDTLLSLLLGDLWSTDQFDLTLSQTCVDIDLADRYVERSMRWDLEPGVELPSKIQNEQEGSR